MKPAQPLSCAVLLCGLLCSSLRAQTPAPTPAQPSAQSPAQAPVRSLLSTQNATAPQGPVSLTDEPHHRLVLQNEFTRVYNVMVPALDATFLHQHDLPYLYVILGPADIINAVVGKPELHQVMQDGETHYSPGHFVHLVRTESGVPFRNVTIELTHPQGTPKNLCKEVLPGGPLDCPERKPNEDSKAGDGASRGESQTAGETMPSARSKSARAHAGAADDSRKTKKDQPQTAIGPRPTHEQAPYFETDEIRVDLHKVYGGADYVDAKPDTSALLVALSDANLDVNLAGEHMQFLHGGDVLWMPAGEHRRVIDFLGTNSGFLLIAFKDSVRPDSTQ
jgi:hypothetical protein